MARLKEYGRVMAYRVYVCDSLYLRGENKYITMRYSDIIQPVVEDERTGDEIITHMKERLKGMGQ